jgi:hypothetical protein
MLVVGVVERMTAAHREQVAMAAGRLVEQTGRLLQILPKTLAAAVAAKVEDKQPGQRAQTVVLVLLF